MEGASDPVTAAVALCRHPATILVDVVVSRQSIGTDAMPPSATCRPPDGAGPV